jgi:hypothetical protein
LIAETANPEQLARKNELDKKNEEKMAEFAKRAADIKTKKKRAQADAIKGIADGSVQDTPDFRAKKKAVMKTFEAMEKELKNDKIEWEVKQ